MDILKVDLICAFAFLISIADFKTDLQIMSLIISISYTLYKFYKDRKN